ncbi:MAG: transposase [Gammaproteobacteria bacterium]|nr:transposase [Acholeplasmataceae bacterium]MCK9529128.1 transposase [Gammaproteobacteria bacterium]
MTTITKGYKFRLEPNQTQRDLLVRSFGHTRFVWNELLAQSKIQYELHKFNGLVDKPNLNEIELVNKITNLKLFHPWLSEVSNVALQQKVRDLASAYRHCFRNLKQGKIAFPKFKKRNNRNSFRLTKNGFRLKDGELYIAKCDQPLKVRWSRDLPSEPSSCTISQEPDGSYYVSFVCQVDPKLTNGVKQTGIDLGLTDFAILSDGGRIANNRFLVQALNQLKRAQKTLSRRKKGSKNRNKARIKVAKLYQKVTNQRNDFLHKLSRKLVNENQVLVVESLNVGGMIKNRHLARGISDVSWSRFIGYLTYKSKESHHCSLLMMDPFYPSSKLCGSCGVKYENLKLSERQWTCFNCHTTHDRDLNAARNILAKGLETFKNLSPDYSWLSIPVICNRFN